MGNSVVIRTIETEIDDEPITLVVAMDSLEQKVLGFVLVDTLRENVFWLRDLCVDGTRRRRRIGTRLLQTVIDLAREREIIAISLSVSRGNMPARRLYKDNRFHLVTIADDDKAVYSYVIEYRGSV